MEILYEDNHLLVCLKPVGVLCENAPSPEVSMLGLLQKQLALPETQSFLFPVHRLDQAVGGVMVFAKTKASAAQLSHAIQEDSFRKEYFAIVQGKVSPEEGTLQDYLYRDPAHNKTYCVKRLRKGVRTASLHYQVLSAIQEPAVLTWLKIQLHTGRTHQIRAQFASRRLPLWGDKKYGARNCKGQIALWSYGLAFPHPVTGNLLTFYQKPPAQEPWNYFPMYKEMPQCGTI